MQFDPEAPVIVVEVEVVGPAATRVVDIALDTGATYVMVPWVVAEALGYDPAVSRRRVNLSTASSVEVAVTLEEVGALGVRARDVEGSPDA